VVDFPDREDLHLILDRTTSDAVPHPGVVMDKERIVAMRELVRKVPLARAVQDYAVRVLQATHPETSEATATSKKYLRYGASPRGLQAIILAAKIRALLEGRFAVSIDDVRVVAPPALRHRLILNFEGEAEGVRADAIIAEILKHTRETA
jgi:MoxR-like ATPase